MPVALLRRAGAVVVALLLGLGTYEFWYWTHGLDPGAETYLFKQGTSLRGVAQELRRRGVIVEPVSFVWGATLTGAKPPTQGWRIPLCHRGERREHSRTGRRRTRRGISSTLCRGLDISPDDRRA